MKNIYFLLLLIIFSSCNKKTVLLPEIENANITEILDVSPAYLFYDITKPDSVDLNRKNLISTTNWLVNVDKRLTLNQAIPHITFLQEKKKNSSHKNVNARNYFTCNDTSIKNLGFIDFTDVNYRQDKFIPEQGFYDQSISINVTSSDSLYFSYSTTQSSPLIKFHKNNLSEEIKSELKDHETVMIHIMFNKYLTFQDYIGFKSILLELDLPNVSISSEEFIY